MKRLFTQLLNAFAARAHALKISVFTLLFWGIASASYAAVVVTPATGGTNICSNTAADGSAPAYTALGDIVITEALQADFGYNGPPTWNVSVTITAPAGWSFDNATPPTLSYVPAADITGFTQFSFTASVLTVRISGSTRVNADAITISGLRVRPNNTYSASGAIVANAVFGAAGLSNIDAGDLSVTPLPITGARSLCIGNTTTLSDPTPGGVWSTTTSSVATVSGAGIVSGGTAGVAGIRYTVAGCITTFSLTVNAPPSAIGGTPAVCAGATTTLSNTVTGGVWTSGTTTAATITPGTGIVSGQPGVVNSPSTTVISYTTAGCTPATVVFTVNPRPNTISGTLTVCSAGGTTSLSTNIGGGTWVSSNVTAATVTPSGIPATVTGVNGGLNAPLTYTLPTGCVRVTTVTVNRRPSAISGTSSVCTGLTTLLSNAASGGTWSSSNSGLATITTAGRTVSGVAAGSPVISYNVASCPSATLIVTVNQSPSAISGPTSVCQGSSVTLSNDIAGGVWSSSNINRATVTAVGAVATVTGAAFTGNVNITYVANTCSVVKAMTVNLTPGPIAGNTTVCTGAVTVLSNPDAGGTWSSSLTPIATAIAANGNITGVAAGTAIITYSFNTGCLATTTLTVHQSPGAIAGPGNVCEGFTAMLSDATPGGTWSSTTSSVATIHLNNGDVHGVAAGVTTITYQEPVNGCIATLPFTVNSAPSAILGNTTVCQAATTVLSNTSPGGIWSSDNTTVADITSGGVVSGISGGTTNITYDFGTACYATATVTVLPLPDAGTIVGPSFVCLAGTTALTNAVSGGVWSTDNTSVATITSSGVVGGGMVGSFNAIYTTTNSCGSQMATLAMTVDNFTPAVSISADLGFTTCLGSVVTYTATPTNGGVTPAYSWSVNGVVFSAMSTTTYTPVNNDTLRVVLTSSSSCLTAPTATDQVVLVVNPNLVPSVAVSNAPYGDTVCIGTSVPFTATAVNGGTAPGYLWYVNGVPQGTINPFNYIPNNHDIISVELSSSYPCATPAAVFSNSVTMTVDISQTPAISITSSANPSCEGSPVTYTAHTLYGGLTPFLRWTQNGINVATGPMYTIVPSNGDQVFCTLRSSSVCRTIDSVSSNVIVEIVDQPVVPSATVIASAYAIGMGETTTLTALVTPLGLSPTYQWFLNGVAIVGATANTYVAAGGAPGSSYYYCIVGNGNACNTTSISNLITINVYAVSVNEVATGTFDLRLVPNPNSGTFNVEGLVPVSNNGKVTLQVTNMIGQVVYSTTAASQGNKINAQVSLGSDIANGVYMMHVIANDTHHAIRFSVNR